MADSAQTLEDLVREIEENDGILSIPMGTLREIHGEYSRLGERVVKEISKELSRHGIGHYPNPMPTYQSRWTRLFRKGTPIEDLIRAVAGPDPKNDMLLRDMMQRDARETLNKIKAMICET